MRIGIVNDSAMSVEALRRVLARQGEHQVCWLAHNGEEAVENCRRDTPDLVLMDLMMPVMDGAAATRRIMQECPCAILIVTGTVDGHAAKVFETLGAGALDVVSTPVLGMDGSTDGGSVLLAKIRVMEQLIGPRPDRAARQRPGQLPAREAAAACVVAIGASAGGPAALAKVLSDIPGDPGPAIVIVQHIDAQFTQSMATWLDGQTPLRVRLAREGDTPQPGTVLLAATNDHLAFLGPDRLGYTREPLNTSYRPSVDVFLCSVARHCSGRSVGVLLTGMGRDGAVGLKAMRDAGARTIAQDRESSVVYGMPKAAADLDAASEILPLDKIGRRVGDLCGKLLGN